MFRRLFRLPARSAKQIDAEMRDEIDAASRRSRGSGRREFVRTAFRDLGFAIRQGRRAPSFALGVVLSLGFGIGASATIYSWMQGMVLRPLPAVRDAGRLITVRPEQRLGWGISLDEYTEWRDQAQSISGLAGTSLSMFAIETDVARTEGTAHPIFGMFVSANYFDVLGVGAAHGRTFVSSDDSPAAPLVALISDAAWRAHFGSDRGVVGRLIRVNGSLVQIIGIAPPNFGGNLAAARFDLWVTLHARPHLVPSESAGWRRRDSRWLDAIGRLQPGVELPQANAEFRAIAARQAASFPENADRDARAIPLDMGTAMQLAPLFFALMIVTTLVVLLICSNVANLLLTRAAARHRELAIRLSLGASRARLVVQLMTESAGLAAGGALLGTGIAMIGGNTLTYLMPATSVTIGIPSQLDMHFVAFVVALTGGCVIAFGLVPAMIGSRVDLVDALKNGGRGSGAARSRTRTAFVVAQFVFALSTLVMAALFLRRDRAVHAMDLGFRDANKVLLLQMEMSLSGQQDLTQWRQTVEQAADKVAELPSVRRVAIGSFVPLGLVGYARQTVVTPWTDATAGPPDRVFVNAVSDGYFDLMGIPVLNGRPITDEDTPDRAAVAVINQAFAQKYFSHRPAVGRTFTLGGREHLVIGTVENGRYDYRAIDVADNPMVYTAWKQAPRGLVTIHVRTGGDPMALAAAGRSAINQIDPSIPLLAPVTLEDYAGVPFSISRSALTVLTILATAALALASMGLFSVISYGVTLRTREIGIRIALGATRLSVMSMFLGNVARLIAYGTGAGVGASLLLVTLLRTRVPLLPVATINEFILPVLTLGFFAVAAGLIPARRAASVDPARTLREE